ncbi:type I polyketide synthase [Aspergillus saccharolyticus JOP 1030-1]|uniref:KR-domain-containing protein n=1 Tax=Aspergillus saccharolyticus JOP 1030-1 TaxID=1450539 RepID=A0A318ZB36_9EURO|nr:KR-domain-containing protein [Aspergillus saccharolyticus JOP 1030-1]PYH44655.1 KR-domain-containing protein [Aspergillus saccharolyticus JOP 1030-1]
MNDFGAVLDALKATIKRARKLIWVTRGATEDCQNPRSNLIIGMESPLRDDEVEMQVFASGVNFQHLMIRLGRMPAQSKGGGVECAGIVTAVGKNFQHAVSKGNHVYAWNVPWYSSHVRSQGSMTHRIPEGLAMEEAAAVPVVYCTAYHCLLNVARMKPGETILIHSGTGGVGQAAIVLARQVGAEVFTTVGLEVKRKHLIREFGLPRSYILSSRSAQFSQEVLRLTNGRGVDIVLNALSGPLLQASLNALAPIRRFIEIEKSDLLGHSRLDMGCLTRSISFSVVVDLALVMFEERVIKQAVPLVVGPISSLEGVLRRMQKGEHMGKLVVSHGKNDMVKVLPRAPVAAKFSDEATYIVVGGQRGLGRVFCVWLARHGARHIVALSPSEPDKPLTRGLEKDLHRSGAQLHALRCRVKDKTQLQAALRYCRESLPPIREVLHAGLTVRDATFEKMSTEDYRTVRQPKIDGTYNLHDALQGQSLDFFIILSSYMGLVGSPGQSNYAAASTFQDAFAGVPALVGYAVSNPCKKPEKSQVAIGWAPPSTWTDAHYETLDPLLSYLNRRTAQSFSERLSHCESLDECVSAIVAALCQQITDILGVATEAWQEWRPARELLPFDIETHHVAYKDEGEMYG